jgi:hypothetical protein
VTDVGQVAPATLIPGSRPDDASDIAPGWPAALDPRPAVVVPPSSSLASTGRRTALALWLTRPDHPLTARVIVNRIWQQHFGRGLVGTASDFGVLGDRPSHPELLDYLATQFVEGGWRLKALHRQIVTSATYRQTALRPMPERAQTIDPANRLLWRAGTRRLEAEQIRDAMLAVSGELNLAAGGEGVEVTQPRRSVYLKIFRNKKDGLVDVFDAADGLQTTPQRNVTTTATQALLMMNSDLTLQRAAAWANRLRAESAADDRESIRRAYRAAYARWPTDDELAAALEFVRGGDQAQWVDFCHALLNANEFVYVD